MSTFTILVGTQLFEEGAHLTGGNTHFIVSQTNVAIARFVWVKSSNVPYEQF